MQVSKAAIVAAAALGVAGGSYGIAGAANGTGTTTGTTGTATAAAPAAPSSSQPWGGQRSDETPLTGDALGKVARHQTDLLQGCADRRSKALAQVFFSAFDCRVE